MSFATSIGSAFYHLKPRCKAVATLFSDIGHAETTQLVKGIEKSSRVSGLRPFSMVQLLIALTLLFFFAPFVEEIGGGDLIVSALLSLVLISAVLAVASRGRMLTVALLLAIPAVAGRWINYFRPHLVPAAIFLVAGIGLVAFVVVNLLRFVLRASSVDGEVL